MDKKQIRSLLFGCPLYRAADPRAAEGGPTLELLVLGGNETVLSFLDVALQNAQAANCFLRVRLGCPEPEKTRAAYCAARPALGRFIDIDGSMDGDGAAPWADLSFFSFTEPTRDALADAVCGVERQLHYVFASLDSAEDSRAAALLCGSFARELGLPRTVLAFADGDTVHVLDESGAPQLLTPPDEEELARMAFNTHLVWAGGQQPDTAALRRSFGDPYNRNASESYVLAVKYLLWSIGISYDASDAARSFQKHVLADDAAPLFGRLVAQEHRRWVTEKLCLGWQGLSGPEETAFTEMLARCSVKDDAARRHPCICRCGGSMPLDGFAPEAWDSGAEPKDLDELDRLSLSLHRFFAQRREELRAQEEADTLEELSALRGMAGRADPAAGQEFRRLAFCVKQLLRGSFAYARRFDRFCDRLLDAVKRGDAWTERTEALRRRLFPALEASLRRNYKSNDARLLRSIPFILTYRPSQHLAMAFELPDSAVAVNDCVFSNLASVTELAPGRLTWLVRVSGARKLSLLRRMLRPSLAYLRSNRLLCPITLCVSASPEVRAEELRNLLGQIQTEYPELHTVEFPPSGDEKAVSRFLETCTSSDIRLFDGSTRLFSSGASNADFIAGIRERLPYFEYDPASRQFSRVSGCGWVHGARRDAYLRIDDMLALTGSSRQSFDYAEFTDTHQALWRLFTAEPAVWNAFCETVRETYEDELRSRGLFRSDSRVMEQVIETRDDVLGACSVTAAGQQLALARELEILGCLRIRTDADGKNSRFVIPDGSWRVLLSKAGMLLELYVFQKAFETGYFDDIAWSFFFNWVDSSVSNEMDLVLTKGFRSLLVECKSTALLKQDYYHKLGNLSDLFGICAKKALVANPSFETRYLEQENRRQIRRGEEMDVVTLFGEDLEDIGQRLADLMADR